MSDSRDEESMVLGRTHDPEALGDDETTMLKGEPGLAPLGYGRRVETTSLKRARPT
jgi:hypothetical protein